MLKRLSELMQVKKLIALGLTLVFCIMALREAISSEQFLTVFSLVVAFYFGQSTVRDTKKE
ncbi:hypothetical protein [Clostridium cellulovorans]|jgi:hypothetical protein|uniref:Phage exported protein n=1 Tax=Clostridium cellulovorans (strain ATCC 35296 / DSM 3052 / OCM 3 / 743B) TaxID=573061 RepID=D9SVY9_CLOC7|nr:hypothetical protein [Clostridium cellulovorans]ADL53200.1 hypothetical protein Clocel_3524 [Clostridium cellulovorans 743B]